MLGTGGATSTGTSGIHSSTASEASVTILILWYCIYGFTWCPGCWVVAGEDGAGQLRERNLFLASMGSFVTSMPINFVNPDVQADICGAVTFIYGSLSVVTAAWARVVTKAVKDDVCTGLGAEITELDRTEGKDQEVDTEWVEEQQGRPLLRAE
ncbi:hypothetical protein BJX99DRAFT_259404 [Aspergillus californicus]